jgi:hypothetical protein
MRYSDSFGAIPETLSKKVNSVFKLLVLTIATAEPRNHLNVTGTGFIAL